MTNMRWLLPVMVIPMLVACGGAGPLKPQPTTSSRTLESAVVREINALRSSSGKSSLREQASLDAIARQHSQFLSQHTGDNRIYRSGIAHANAQDRFVAASHAGYRMISENVYATTRGGSEAVVAKNIAQGWWNSRPHRVNILRESGLIGVGIVRGANGATFATAIFATHGGGSVGMPRVF